MTYKDLLAKLQTLTENELNQDINIIDENDEIYYGLDGEVYCEYSNENVLDEGSVFLKLKL